MADLVRTPAAKTLLVIEGNRNSPLHQLRVRAVEMDQVVRIRERMEAFRAEEDAIAMAAAGQVDDELAQDVNWNKGYAYHAIGMAAILDDEDDR